MDALTIPIPEAHIWAVVAAWIGAFIAGRMIGGRSL